MSVLKKIKWYPLLALFLVASGFAFNHFFVIQWSSKPYLLSEVTAENIYVINLDRTLERHFPLKKQLDELKLPFTRWSAVDGYKLSITGPQGESFSGRDLKTGKAQFKLGETYLIQASYDTISYTPQAYTLSAGELGCVISHVEIWDHMVKDNIPWALIFEDDANLMPTFRAGLESALANLPEKWDLLYVHDPIADRGKKKFWVLGDLTLCKLGRDLDFYVLGAHGYMISLAGAQKLVAYSKKNLHLSTDMMLSQAINDGAIDAYIKRVPIVNITQGPSLLDEMGR